MAALDTTVHRAGGDGPAHKREPDISSDPGGTAGDARRTTFAVVGLGLLLAGMLALFAWPGAHTGPRDVPLGVVGTDAGTGQVERALDHALPDAFDTHRYTTRAAAVRAIEQRDVDAALVLGPSGVEALTASASSPVRAQLVGQVATEVAGQHHVTATVTDVVPLTEDDPRGAGLGAALLPIILGGMACAAALSLTVRRRSWRIGGALAFSVVGGLGLAAVLDLWIGSVDANYLAVSGVLALATAAVSLTVLGLESLVGTAGLGLGAVTMILFGNALSGAQSAPDLLPSGWGLAGQLLPPGATNTLLRDVAFFDGHGGWPPALVLTGWICFGLVLTLVAAVRRSRSAA